jgi:hypothetical protein
MPTGDVSITINDGGAAAILVPGSTVQVVLGTCSAGTATQIIATQNPNTLTSNLGYGKLPEAAALTCLAGGTVLAIKCTSNAPGASTAVVSTATGTSIVTVSVGTAYDDYLVQMTVVTGGTIGTTGIVIKLSLDGGKNYGPEISIGTAVTYAITNTGLTLAFAAGTMVAGDYHRFSTTAPHWNAAGLQAALVALTASPYALAGWGSLHVAGAMSASDAASLQTYLTTMQTGFLYTRALVDVRDAIIPIAWGGAGETEAVWLASIATAFSATDAKRICANAGHYNMPSAFPTSVCGAPRYRRSLAWAIAARAVTIPPQRHAGRVRDGSLSNITVDPITDPTDGFVYHDARITSGLQVARFSGARTRVGKQGFYNTNPNLMSATGSVFTILPLGNIMDIACSIIHQVGQDVINSDIRLNANGTIYENEAKAIEIDLLGAINVNMTSNSMISSATVVVNRTTNIAVTSTVVVTVTIVARGYILEETVTVGFQNPFAAGAA